MSGLTNTQIISLHQGVQSGIFPSSLLDELRAGNMTISECEVLDFKVSTPSTDSEYVKIARDVVALHNSYGGFIAFGIGETIKDRSIEVCGIDSTIELHIQKLKDFIKNYCGCEIRLQVARHVVGEKEIEVVYSAKRSTGEKPLRFTRNGPDEKAGKPIFKKNDIVFRRIDCNAIANAPEDYDFLYSDRRPPSIEIDRSFHEYRQPLASTLPDRSLICARFVGRSGNLSELWEWLADDFSRVKLIAGEGGLGKTSLAYRFCEDIVTRNIKPFDIVLWLTAKRRQFIPAADSYRDSSHVDFDSANSLYRSICLELGQFEQDVKDLETRDLMKLALESCSTITPFLVIDDVDSLTPDDQKSVMEFGLRTAGSTKLLLTTRVNFSYAPENVLKLNGLEGGDFSEFVRVLRSRYQLYEANDKQIGKLFEATGGSPLFTDSLLRLEKRGLSLDAAVSQWRGEKGIEARKAALLREVQQLSREAKRVLYVTSLLKNCSYTELSQIVDYSEQTLGDALHELDSLFLISAPAIAKEARYTVEPNTGALVLEIATSLGIDHSALQQETKRSRTDAVGLSLTKRLDKVGLAISQAMAKIKAGDPKSALDSVVAAAKQLSKPHPDLLLMSGRCHLVQNPPNYNAASKDLEQSFTLGQRKTLLFPLWFQAEYGRGDLDATIELIDKALRQPDVEPMEWFEKRAQIRIERARRRASAISPDSFYREIDEAIRDLKSAIRSTRVISDSQRIARLISQSFVLKAQFLLHDQGSNRSSTNALTQLQNLLQDSQYDQELLTMYFDAVTDVTNSFASRLVGRPHGNDREELEAHHRYARHLGHQNPEITLTFNSRQTFHRLVQSVDRYQGKRSI